MPRENIATEDRAMTITAEVKAQAPILGLLNTDLKSEFGSESGDTVSALIPGFGQVGEGLALPSDPSSYALSIQKVPLQVTPKNIPASYDFIDASIRIGSFDQKVARPYGAHLASHIRREAFGAILGGATRQFVLNNLADLNFAKVAQAIASVEDSNMGGQINCVLSNRLQAALTGSGLNQFQNSNVAFDLWKGEIKNFDGADFVSQSEAIKFKAPVITGGTLASSPAEGGDTLNIAFTGMSVGTVIPAGYVFKIEGINSVDIFKKDDGYARAFVVQEPVTYNGGTTPVAVKVGKMYAANPALKNLTKLPANGDTVTLLLSGNRTYHTCAIFDQNSTGYASAAIKEAPGADSSVSTVDGFVNVRMTAQFRIETGLNIVRFDILTGAKSLYGQGVAGLWVPVD